MGNSWRARLRLAHPGGCVGYVAGLIGTAAAMLLIRIAERRAEGSPGDFAKLVSRGFVAEVGLVLVMYTACAVALSYGSSLLRRSRERDRR